MLNCSKWCLCCWTLHTSESRSQITESIELWCWRWTDQLILFSIVGNDEVLHTAKEESNSVHKIIVKNCNLIGHILFTNCLIENDIAWKNGRLEVTGRRRRRRKQPQNDLKERREYCKLSEEAVIALFGGLAVEEAKGFSWVRLRNEWMNEQRMKEGRKVGTFNSERDTYLHQPTPL